MRGPFFVSLVWPMCSFFVWRCLGNFLLLNWQLTSRYLLPNHVVPQVPLQTALKALRQIYRLVKDLYNKKSKSGQSKRFLRFLVEGNVYVYLWNLPKAPLTSSRPSYLRVEAQGTQGIPFERGLDMVHPKLIWYRSC